MQDAKLQGIEAGTQLGIDSTVTETDIPKPSDSRLCYDGVRVLTRLLGEGQKRVTTVTFRDHCRVDKRDDQEIHSARAAPRRDERPSTGVCSGW